MLMHAYSWAKKKKSSILVSDADNGALKGYVGNLWTFLSILL